MTVTLKDGAGGAGQGRVTFQNTSTTSSKVTTAVSTGQSEVISSGSTLGCVDAVQCTLFVYAFLTSTGTIVPGIGNQIILDEGVNYTSTVLAGSGNDDAKGVVYTSAPQSARPFRIIGRIRTTQTTAGTWAADPDDVSPVPFVVRMPWFLNARIDGANPTLGVAAVSSYTEIIDAGLTLTVQSNQSVPVGIMCSTTNAAATPNLTSSTCSAGSESLGVSFPVYETGIYEICAAFSWDVTVDQGERLGTAFELIETPTNAQTLTQEGGQRTMNDCFGMAIAGGTAAQCGVANRICGLFNFTTTGTKGIRLMYEQGITGTPNAALILGDASATFGQRAITFTGHRW